MSEDKLINTGIRLPGKMIDQIKATAREYDVEPSIVHRWALKAFLQYIRRHKGRVVLPLDFDEWWQRKMK